MTPAPAFEKTMCGRDPRKGCSIGQVTARINFAPSDLANIQSFSARVLALRQTTARPDARHEQHARAVIVF
jgi:hypothetical protein